MEGRGIPDSTGFITLARVIKAQGRHGEVAAEVHTDVPERFSPGMKLFALGKEESPRRELEVEDLWPHKGLLVFKFQGVDTMNDAETLIGAELQLPRTERAELEQGWTYVSDLVGCTVFDRDQEIGRITDVQFGAGEAPLLIVLGKKEREGKQYDVPFAEAYLVGVDIAQRKVKLRLPEGMLEINAPMSPEEKREHQSGPERKQKRS